MSQVDITPSVLELLRYSGTYSGFGRNVFDASNGTGFAINKPGSLYQIIDSELALDYDLNREKSEFLYLYHEQEYYKRNLANIVEYAVKRKKLEDQLKATVQRYQEALTRRKLQ